MPGFPSLELVKAHLAAHPYFRKKAWESEKVEPEALFLFSGNGERPRIVSFRVATGSRPPFTEIVEAMVEIREECGDTWGWVDVEKVDGFERYPDSYLRELDCTPLDTNGRPV